MRIISLFGRYPNSYFGNKGDAFVGVWTSCTSDPTKDDLVIANYFKSRSILVDNHCYSLSRIILTDLDDYPGVGEPALTEPIPTITSTHSDCTACDASVLRETFEEATAGPTTQIVYEYEEASI